MPEIAVKITNIDQIRRAFNRSPFLMAKELNKAIEKTVFKVEQQSKINTPVDTGRLRASHYTEFSNLRGAVGTDTNYDIFVHEGTRYMKARPYLRTAIDETSKSIDDYFKDAVQNVLDTIGSEI